jgi:tripartite ATP-independent transporter DctP family solute receptor
MRLFGKGFSLFLVLLLGVALLAAATPRAEAAKKVARFAHNMPPKPQLLYQGAALTFKNFLNIYSKGEADIQIFPSSQLGKDSVAAKKVQLGSIQFQIVASNNITSFDRRLDIFTLPFMFSSFKGAAKVFNSDIGKQIGENFRKKSGIRVLGFIATGFRNMMNSKHPIKKPADLGDLRMRIAKNPIMVSTYKSLGGSTIGMAPTELFSALSTKTVDGHDGGSSWAWAMKLYEVQKYLSITRHQLVAGAFIVNDKYYSSQPKHIQKAIQRAAKDTIAWANAYAEENEKEIIKGFAAKGLKIDRPDLAPFQKAVKPVHKKFADKVGGMALIERILAMQK